MKISSILKNRQAKVILRMSLGTLLFSCLAGFGQISWTVASTPGPNFSGGGMLLLSDGSVICKTTSGGNDGVGSVWDKLTPNVNGSYINGTWSSIAPMNDTRLYFSSQTLMDGRIYVAGGEYGTGTAKSEIYDPVMNTWTLAPFGGSIFSDANSAILKDGRILQANLNSPPYAATVIFDPIANTYVNGPTCINSHGESTWLKLPDNSILFIDGGSTSSERYIPAMNQWIADANVPVNLYDPYGTETGPGLLLPDGRAFFLGSLGNTAIYTPSGNNSPGSWVAGPNIPGGNGVPDGSAAMMADGKIVFAAAPVPISTNSLFLAPTTFYEYDYVSNTISPINAPGGGPNINIPSYQTNMLNLPDGSIMLAVQGSKAYYFHKPSGTPLAIGKPTVTTVSQNGCSNTFSVTGLLFNGISEGASYGDDWQMNTNFPIVRLTSGTNVYYARTYNWNRTGVQTGSLPDTTMFTLPGNIPNGTYSLCVVANGISSDPFTFTFTPFPALTSALIAPNICSGSTFNYNAVANMTNTTMMWTRAAVAGISNAAVTTPQSANPNEVLINTTNTAKSVAYSYTLTNGSCTTYYQVNVLVKPNVSLSVTGAMVVCENDQTTLTAHGLTTYSWSTNVFSPSITVGPLVTTIYTVSGTNSFGCFCIKQCTVTVNPLPTLSLTATPQLLCIGDSAVVAANGNGDSFYWDNGQTTSSIKVVPGTTTSYTVIAFSNNGCQRKDSIKVTVQACTGLKEYQTSDLHLKVYPNPFRDKLNLEYDVKFLGEYQIKLYDVFGRVVKEKNIELVAGMNKNEINADGLAKGVYMFVVKNNIEVYSLRLIKE